MLRRGSAGPGGFGQDEGSVKEKFFTLTTPLGQTLDLYKMVWDGGNTTETFTFVSGMYGNQLNGIYLVNRLNRFFQEIEENQDSEYSLEGRVQLFPLINFNAFQEGNRLWALDNLDLDQVFPGNALGEFPDRLCQSLLQETKTCTYALLFQDWDPHFDSVPHVHIYKKDRAIKNMARFLGLDIAIESHITSALPMELYAHWIDRDIQALVVKGGKSDRVEPDLCDDLFFKILNLIVATGILKRRGHESEKYKVAFFSQDQLLPVMSHKGGMFVPLCPLGSVLEKNQKIGDLINVFTGETIESFHSPCEGILFSLRDYPVIYGKDTVAIVLKNRRLNWNWTSKLLPKKIERND